MQATAKRNSEPPAVKRKVGRPRSYNPVASISDELAAQRNPVSPRLGRCVPSIVSSPEIEAMERGLTAKQILLARILANEYHPVAKVEAYRAVYDLSNPENGTSEYSEASVACSNPKVASLQSAITAESRRMNSAVLSDREALRMRIASQLLQLAETSTDEKVRLQALKTLGETIHARSFARAEPDEATQAAGDLAGELLSKLRNLVADRTPTVDLMPQLDGEVADSSSE